jgi:hypothetical protein
VFTGNSTAIKQGVGIIDDNRLHGMYFAQTLKFSPFNILWSGRRHGEGYIYYPTLTQDSFHSTTAVRIAITHQHNIAGINALDSRWLYTNYPRDPGERSKAY